MILFDTNENLEKELLLLELYEKYNKKIENLQLGLLKKNDVDYLIVKKLCDNLPSLLEKKQKHLKNSKIMRDLKLIESKIS
jgi:hypothetical protein